MFWVYVVVGLGLLGFGAEILLSYRKEQARITREMNENTREILADRQVVATLKADIKDLSETIDNLQAEKDKLNKDINWQDQNLAELVKRDEHRHMGRHRLDRD